MSLRTLTEDFRRMGLSEGDVSASLRNLLGESADVEIEEDDDNEDGDVLSIVEAYKKRKKLRGKEKKAARAYRRSAAGRKAAKKSQKRQKKKRKTAAYKRRQAKLAKMGPAKKGYVRMVSSREYDGDGESLRESLISNLHVLAESMDHDPEERFNEYVEAFNNIADLSELLTLKYHEMDEEEIAEEVAMLAILAEGVLEEMEDYDGVVNVEQDKLLESALANVMGLVESEIELYNELLEDDDDDYDDDDELDEDDDDDEDDEDELDEGKSKKGKGKPKSAKKGKKGKGKKMSSLVKSLASRSDVKDPEKLAGWLRWNDPNAEE